MVDSPSLKVVDRVEDGRNHLSQKLDLKDDTVNVRQTGTV